MLTEDDGGVVVIGITVGGDMSRRGIRARGRRGVRTGSVRGRRRVGGGAGAERGQGGHEADGDGMHDLKEGGGGYDIAK